MPRPMCPARQDRHIYIHTYIDYIYIYIYIGGSRLQWKPAHVQGSKEKKRRRDEEGGKRALAPKELSPPPPHRRRPATPQRITAACSSTHDGPTRASAGAQIPDPHGIHEWWCWCHRRSSHRQNIQIQTNRDRDETRDSTKRGVGKRGAGPQKLKSRAAAMAARALSLILKRTVRRPPESPSRLHVI